MIVDYLHVFGVLTIPSETNPKLIVYANAVLASAIALKYFQTVTRRDFQKTQGGCRVNELEFTTRGRLDEFESTSGNAFKQPLRIPVSEGFYSHNLLYIDKR
jgi:hypothetical protein